MNASHSSTATGSGLVYNDRFPLAWQVLPDVPSAPELAHWQGVNNGVLKAVAGLDAIAHESLDETASSHELLQLELRLNLLLDITSRLVSQNTDFPDARQIELGASQLIWQIPAAAVDDAPDEHAVVLLSLYLSRQYPTPLVLPARVTGIESRGRTRYVTAVFIDPGAAVVDGLEKFIFRAHRRQVHQERQIHSD